jgi:thioredoxin reductase (NADPH)
VLGPVSGAELVQFMRDQAASFGAELVTDKVVGVDLQADLKQVWSGQGAYQGRAVIIATGAMGRTQHVPGEERLLGRGVSYCATCDGAFFRDQAVAVVGNNDEAVEEALVLTRFASQVHFLNPTSDLRASPELTDELVALPQVTLYPATQLREVVGEKHVEAVRVRSRSGDEHAIPVSGVFIYLQGNVPIVDFLGDQLPVGADGCLIVDESHQTAIPGVFAAGDVLCKHLKQVALAAAEGVVAATAVDRYLHGRKKLRPDWSR